MTAICVIDVGTTTLRAAIVNEHLDIVDLERRAIPPVSPGPGLVEFDAAALARDAVEAATAVIERSPETVRAVGLSNQRGSTVVWDRSTGEPIGPGLGWQDLRTVFACIMAEADHGLKLAPNQSITKLAWILDNVAGARDRDLCFGTVDAWLTWTLSRGEVHVTDATNVGITGMGAHGLSSWNPTVLSAFSIPAAMLPAIVPSVGVSGAATALPGAPALAARAGDQQCSLVGQGCVSPGRTKITFGSGGMLDVCLGTEPPAAARRLANGTFPIAAWSTDHEIVWGLEGIMLAAGSNIEWLRDDLGLIDSSAASHELASTVASTDGVVFVPALFGLGTPQWDYGARGTLLGLTAGITPAHLVRAVLDGIAHRGVDLIDAAAADAGRDLTSIRIDGGMAANPTFVQALADLSGRVVEVSPVLEATTRGAAFLAGVATGAWTAVTDADELWKPSRLVEPHDDRAAERSQWAEAVRRAGGWLADLSALDF